VFFTTGKRKVGEACQPWNTRLKRVLLLKVEFSSFFVQKKNTGKFNFRKGKADKKI
jgi:hypothetical protein